MAIHGVGAIITEGEAYYYGHIYLSPTSNKALTYGKMADNADSNTYGYFAGSWITDAMRSTASVTPPAINRYKCVYSGDISNQSVRVPWYVKISENVTGSTNANKIELRCYYEISSTSTEVYKSCGMWDYGSTISSSASSTHYFEANPYLLFNSYGKNVYSSRLAIWCGTTSKNQTWKWRLRTKTGPQSGTWGSWNTQSSNGKTCIAYISGDFFSAMATYNGIEFNVD